MSQCRGRAPLGQELITRPSVVIDLGANELDRHLVAKKDAPGAIHVAHPTAADTAREPVATVEDVVRLCHVRGSVPPILRTGCTAPVGSTVFAVSSPRAREPVVPW